ncbi:hypothetical protein HPB48_005850 [Haemaphysalis longicornis]|uniref:Uncharacterized protein n=1 Tax=Haemaphysalis longicornis TaxID=44386 RepID=A0A9J6GPX0_HAELO|nr:hypothetical protein HPB48_005850 [Haemaphysalis longicornis]
MHSVAPKRVFIDIYLVLYSSTWYSYAIGGHISHVRRTRDEVGEQTDPGRTKTSGSSKTEGSTAANPRGPHSAAEMTRGQAQRTGGWVVKKSVREGCPRRRRGSSDPRVPAANTAAGFS